MPKILDVFHELNNGKALKTKPNSGFLTYLIYFVREGSLWACVSNSELPQKSQQIDVNKECEVIDIPERLIERVSFSKAMKALKNGKKVKSLKTEYVYRLDAQELCMGCGSVDTTLCWSEIDGQWIIL